MQDYNLVDIRHEKVSPYVKFEIILPLLCFFLDPLTTHPARRRRSDVSVVRRQDVSLARLHDVIEERREDGSRIGP